MSQSFVRKKTFQRRDKKNNAIQEQKLARREVTSKFGKNKLADKSINYNVKWIQTIIRCIASPRLKKKKFGLIYAEQLVN